MSRVSQERGKGENLKDMVMRNQERRPLEGSEDTEQYMLGQTWRPLESDVDRRLEEEMKVEVKESN